MNSFVRVPKTVLILGVPIVLFSSIIYLIQSSFFLKQGDIMGLAITIDLLVIVPFIYFLLIRKSTIPKTTVVPIMVVGLVIGSYFLPQAHQQYLDGFKTMILPVIEITVLGFVIYKIRQGRKKYKAVKSGVPDFFSAVKTASAEILPGKVVLPFATEIAVIYYGFINWKKRKLTTEEFTYHKETGILAVFAVFVFLIIVETFVLHLLLMRWSELAAWILSAISVYSALQIIGIARSIPQRPIAVHNKKCTLRFGIMNETSFSVDLIENIEETTRTIEKEEKIQKLSPVGDLTGHNLIIHLKEKVVLNGLYGIQRKGDKIALHIDQPKEFKQLILEEQNQPKSDF